jgi:curved DNA-binding protein CbpA
LRWIAIAGVDNEAKFERLWAYCFAEMLRIDSRKPIGVLRVPLCTKEKWRFNKMAWRRFESRFLARYDDQAGTKPERGENLTATATVPPETAELGGFVRVAPPTGRVFDVMIPAGFEEGTQIRLRGQGQPGPIGDEPGDALITIKIAP